MSRSPRDQADQAHPGPHWLYEDRYRGGPWRAPRPADAGRGLRVSDAERSSVIEVLSRSFSEGYLDQGEYDDRLSTAMSAKTRADLTGVLTDLPVLDEPPVRVRRRHQLRRVALSLVILVLVLSGVAMLVSSTPHLPVLFLVIGAVWLWRRSTGFPTRHRRLSEERHLHP